MATGAVIVGSYEPYTVTTSGAVIVGSYGLGVTPTYNTSLISAISRVDQNLGFPQFIIGGRGGSTGTDYALFKKSEVYGRTIWRSEVYKIGRDFDVTRIKFNLVTDLEATTEIVPKLYFDNERSSSVGTVIDITNYTRKFIELVAANFSGAMHGQHSFFLELQFTGSVLATVALPIFIDVDIKDS